jgi:hypothetical protein
MRAEGCLKAVVLVVTLLAPACATKRYGVSAIADVPKASGRSAGYGAQLRLTGIEAAIDALDGAAGEAPPLSLRVRLRSKDLGYSFDPGRVVLRRGGDEWHARRTSAPECGASGVLAEAEGGRLWLAPRACLVLAFDASVGDGAGQEVVFDGLARGRRPIPPVTLSIARRELVARSLTPGARKFGEAVILVPLYILLAPLAAY